MVRAISTRDARLRDWSRVLGEERLVGVWLVISFSYAVLILGEVA